MRLRRYVERPKQSSQACGIAAQEAHTRQRVPRKCSSKSSSRDFGRRWSTPAMVAGSSPSKWAYFDGRQNHFRACNAIVATRSAWVTARIHLSEYRDTRKCRLGRPNGNPCNRASGSSSDLHPTADLSGLRVYRSCSLQTVKGRQQRWGLNGH